MSKAATKTLRTRSQSGSLVALIPAAILIFVVGIGAFAMDVSHNITVRTELQSATDAAALAGARDLLKDSTMNQTDSDALSVAAKNTADGLAVSPASRGCSVTTQYDFDKSTDSGTVTVDASKSINNMFAKLFGHSTDTVNAHSVAKAWRGVTSIYANQGFPMMVSIDTTQGNQQPLYKMNIGDDYVFYINSQQYKNAAWTTFTNKNVPASWLNDVIDQLFGFSPMQPGAIPPSETGDDLSLGNGVSAQKKLAGGAYINVLTDKNFTLILPCMQGDPPYNQSRESVGYITVKVNSVDINQSGGQVMAFHVTIVKGIVKGNGGQPSDATTGAINNGMENISAGTVKLIS